MFRYRMLTSHVSDIFRKGVPIGHCAGILDVTNHLIFIQFRRNMWQFESQIECISDLVEVYFVSVKVASGYMDHPNWIEVF